MIIALWTLLTANWRERLILAGITLVMVVSVALWGYMKGRESCRADELDKARAGEVKIIHDTQVITKVIRDANDKCASTPAAKSILDSVR